MSLTVLRLGHRPQRDRRVTTHLLLAARALGAKNAIYTGTRDPSLETSIREVVENWGGSFSLEHAESWRGVVGSWEGRVVHLTMYGLPVREAIGEVREDSGDKLIVVGGAKVPGEVYGLADWNIAVTGQPHSEVSALAIFLHELHRGTELDLEFEDARLRVVPQAHGKLVEESGRSV